MPGKDEPKAARDAFDAAALAHRNKQQSEEKPAPRLVASPHDEPAAPSAPLRSEPPRCPHCDGKLVAHGDANPYKVGALHCNGCGGCWVKSDGALVSRAGHMAPTGGDQD